MINCFDSSQDSVSEERLTANELLWYSKPAGELPLLDRQAGQAGGPGGQLRPPRGGGGGAGQRAPTSNAPPAVIQSPSCRPVRHSLTNVACHSPSRGPSISAHPGGNRGAGHRPTTKILTKTYLELQAVSAPLLY